MTTHLFLRSTDRREGPEPDDEGGPRNRWVLHRAGLLNVWQYDRVELRFAGGRLLLRGRNGAGKSKALEVLLPFLFDGDTRQLDATGRDRTTVRWLMTDGRASGHHLGYVWLELRCVDDNGAAVFQTLGAGLKASTATGKADSWFFLTPRRVGLDLDLDVAGECLSIERLKEVVGEEAVTTSGAEHRRRVGRHVFGLFDEARYRNLLHLLHRLRDPNIGNRVEAGELASVLTDALPPIDERVLSDAAGHFDDLEAIRDQVDRSQRTAQALGQFLGAYRGYTRTALHGRAAAVEGAEAGRSRAARTTRQRAGEADAADQAAEAASTTLESLRGQRREGEAERRELERSEGYRAHQDVADRQARVGALEATATIAASSAGRAEAVHRRASADLAAAAGEVERSLGGVSELAASVAGAAAGAGVDPALLGPPPTAAGDGWVDPGVLAVAEERARAARTLVDVRRQRATHVRGLAQRSEQAEVAAASAEEQAAGSEAEVERERAELTAARAAQRAAEQAWVDLVEAWLTTGLASALGLATGAAAPPVPTTGPDGAPAQATGPAVGLSLDWGEVHARLSNREGEPTWTAAVRRSVIDALAPALQAARDAAAEADVRVAAALEALTAAEERLAEVEAQTEAHPPAARFRQADRDPSAGTPFYELVDVAPGVDPASAAGVEAALEAAGLLDAWVQADGLVVHPDTQDTLVRPSTAACPPGSATLADVLAPSSAVDGPVGRDTVAALLAAIGLGHHPGGGAWVSTGGRWSLGLLHGAWGKAEVEFLGATARRATRERLLAELRRLLVRAEDDVAVARSRAEAAARHRDALEVLPASLPGHDGIDEATRERRNAERSLAGAGARHDNDRRRAETARAAASRLAAGVAHEAASDGLPTTVVELDALIAGLAELREVLADHRRSLADLVRAHERLATRRGEEAERRTEMVAAVAEARQRQADHANAAHELATLRLALAATVEHVLADHEAVTARLAVLDDHLLPGAELALRAADTDRATALAHLDEARVAQRRAEDALTEAGRALQVAVVLPGVLLAAAGRAVAQVADLVAVEPGRSAAEVGIALAATVAPLVDGDDDVSDGTILSRYDRLSDALAGGYDTAIDEQDGIKVIHVADDAGRQPLAVVAARTREEAEAARGRLAAREREVLERFLLRELADEVRSKLLDAHDLLAGTNRTLAGVATSHGKGAHLEWKLRDDATAPATVAAGLLVDELRDEDGDARLRDALLAMIDAERAADPTAGYEQHLRAALDYRSWHRFTVKVTDRANPGSSRVLSNRLGLSQGEQRVLSYLALFAAASSHFEAIARDTPTAPRVLLLDDAFAKVDEPTHAHLLGLLVDLGLDFVLTSERMWGCFESVPSLDIFEAVRDPAHPGVAMVHFRWDGHQRHLVGV